MVVDAFAGVRAELARLRYLIVVPLPYVTDAQGGVWLDALWHHDLMAHLAYLSDLTVLAPQQALAPTAGLVRVEVPEGGRLRFENLPLAGSTRKALIGLPAMARAAARAVAAADIVHSGVAGWPLPPGLVVNPIAVLRRKPLVIVVESAFWRLSGAGPFSRAARLRARVTEGFARWSVRRAAIGIFTHARYRDELGAGSRGELVVAPASWIAEGDLLAEPAAEAAWREKPAEPRFLLAARLVREKGIGTLLAALEVLEARGRAVTVDVIGAGPMAAECAALAGRLGHVRLRLLEPVAYGAPFLSLLRGYHALVVPSLSDEQPRVIFDAAAQGVAVIASDTAGHRQVVQPGQTGVLVPVGDAAALADALMAPGDLRGMGLAALQAARGQTHEAMHLAARSFWRGISGGAS